jgi:hypothetical protein
VAIQKSPFSDISALIGMSEIRKKNTVLLYGDSIVTWIIPLNSLQKFGSVSVFETRNNFSFGRHCAMNLMDAGRRLATHEWKF